MTEQPYIRYVGRRSRWPDSDRPQHHSSRVTVYRGRNPHDRPYALQVQKPSGSAYPKSPDGHAWGYNGSGPSQMALDVLWDFYGIEPHPAFYQAFKQRFIEPCTDDVLEITGPDIDAWAATYEGERWVRRVGV